MVEEPTPGTQRAIVLDALKARGTAGATCDRLEELTGLAHRFCSARVCELVHGGFAAETERKELTRRGQPATVLISTGK